jgi:hypothetical protein
MTTPAAFWSGIGYSMNGARSTSTGFTIDGVETGNPVSGNQNSEFWMDIEATRETRISSVSNSAEYSSIGVMNQTSMSGTNSFHGQVSYQHSSGALAASPFFFPAGQRPNNRDHRYYGSVGGPVILPGYNGRDRTFFYYQYDGWRLPTEQVTNASFPTDAMRAGDLSALAPAIIDPTTGGAFAAGRIPSTRISSGAPKYLDRFYPRANTGDPKVPSLNYRIVFPRGRNDWSTLARVDQNIRAGHNLMYRFFTHDPDFMQTDGLPPDVIGFILRKRANWSHLISDTYSLSPTMVNEARVGFQRINWPLAPPVEGKEIVDLVGLRGYPGALSPEVLGMPLVTITGLSNLSLTNVTRNIQNEWDLNDNLSFVRGAHAFKTGINVRHVHFSQFPASPSAQFGTFAFDGFATRQPFGDFLLGIPRTSSRSAEISPFYGRRNSFALFFEDDWKMRPDLTLNLGLRYEFFAPFSE